MVAMKRTGVRLLASALALAAVIAFSFTLKKTAVHLAMPTATPYLYTLTKARMPYDHRQGAPLKTALPEADTTMKTTSETQFASATDQEPTFITEETPYAWEKPAFTSEMPMMETAYHWDEPTGNTATSERPTPTRMSTYPSTELASLTGETLYPQGQSDSTSEMPVDMTEVTYHWDKPSSTAEETSTSEVPSPTGSNFPWAELSSTSELTTEVGMEDTASTTEVAFTATKMAPIATKALNLSTTMVQSTMATEETTTTMIVTSVVQSSESTETEAPTSKTEIPATPKTTASTVTTPRVAVHTLHAPPTVGNYTIEREGGILCVKAEMALQIRVAYRTIFKNMSEGVFLVVPSRTVAKGGCGETTATLHLKFEEGVVFFRFQKNMTTNAVHVSTIAFAVTYPFPNADPKKTYSAKNESLQLFSAQLHHSYSCNQQSISFGRQYYMDIFQQRIQALDFTGPAFGPEDHCPMEQAGSNLTLILCILLLILIATLAVTFFIWKRKKLEGYKPL